MAKPSSQNVPGSRKGPGLPHGRGQPVPPIVRPRSEFTLTRADALAWFGLRREVTGWRRWAAIAWFASAGIALSVLPEAWVGGPGETRHWLIFAIVFCLQLLALMGFSWVKRHWDAARLMPTPRPAWFQDRGDTLTGTAPNGTVLTLEAEQISQIIETPTHLFFSTPGSVLILPAHIFRRQDEKHALAVRWLAKIEAPSA